MGLLSAPWSLLPSGTFLTMLALFLTVFALLYDFMKRRRSWSRFPPGPTSLPFVGNILQADFKNLPKYVTQLRKKYGDVFSLQFCWTNVVIMSGFESVKEGLITKSDDTSDRPHFLTLQKHGFKENSSGVVLARYGQSWRDVRRFSLSTLRDFGLGKKSLAERVTEEAAFLCSAFKSKDGRPFDPHLMINNAVSNVICSIIFGDRFEYDDKNFRKVLKLFEDIIGSGTDVLLQLANVIPVLVHVPGVGQKLFRAQENLFDFLRGIIAEHKASWDPNLKRDFIDAFLEEMEKVKSDPQSSFSELNLLATVSDMFSAGTETTSTTLRHGLLYMMLYSDIQRRVQEEIDRVIGRERKPTMDDRANMPYTNAVIHEIQRYSDILPLSVPHMTSRDTEVNGYFIPKGTTLMFNLSSVLKDESIWARPYQFYPEHFLDDDGQFIKREAFLPFSAVICNANTIINDIVASYPGSAHDSFIFKHSAIHARLLAGQFGDGYLLGDSAYGVRSYILTPYLNPATRKEQHYNQAHKSTRNVIERTFGVLKSRFRILHKTGGSLQYNPKTCCKIVAVCAMLHNMATERGIHLDEEDLLPPIQNQPQQPPARQHGPEAAEGRRRRAEITQNYF